MTQTTADAGVRATSLIASAGLLGLAALAALTMTFSSLTLAPADVPPPPIDVIKPQDPPPLVSEPDRPRTQPIRQDVSQEAAPTLDPIPPMDAIETEVGSAGSVGDGPMTISDPRWLVVPRNLERFYPRRAAMMDREGQVVLDCLVSTVGSLNCSVISEAPAGWGFGQAAIEMARAHRMSPATRDGVAVEGRYRMRVPFALD